MQQARVVDLLRAGLRRAKFLHTTWRDTGRSDFCFLLTRHLAIGFKCLTAQRGTSLLPVVLQSFKFLALENYIIRLCRMNKAETHNRENPAADAAGSLPTTDDVTITTTMPIAGELPSAVELGTLTTEQLDELKARAAKADEHWNRLLRTTADFENFKKRAARERQDAIKFANEALMQRLITVLDNFEMAQAATQTGGADNLKSLQEGIALIYQQLRGALTESGLEEMDATGKPFDPNFHEAVSQQESAEVPEGQVLQQLRKGYKLRERLLRPATVVVAKKPAA